VRGNFAALEAARQARDPRDLTRAAFVERPSAPFAYKGILVQRHRTAPIVSDDGLRYEFRRTEGARRNMGKR
jgi:hypothetical protein